MNRIAVIAGAVVICLALGLLSPRGITAPQDDSAVDEIAQLNQRIDELTTRVARLEQATDSVYPAAGEEEAPALKPNQRSMVVDSIQNSEQVQDFSDEVRQRGNEIKSLESTLASQLAKLARLEGQRSKRRGGRSGGRQVESQINAERRLASRYQVELKRLQKELTQLEKAASGMQQVIVGHEGERIIFLHTETDMSTALADVAVGDSITWRGRRVEMDQNSEAWLVERIREVN